MRCYDEDDEDEKLTKEEIKRLKRIAKEDEDRENDGLNMMFRE